MSTSIDLQQRADHCVFRLVGQWTACPHGDDGQFALTCDTQPVFGCRCWWEPLTGVGYITLDNVLGEHLHKVIGDPVDCQAFSIDLLQWLIDYYLRTMDHA